MTKIIVFLLTVYRNTISPILHVYFTGDCKFTPTCSEYAREAFERFGFFKGTRLSITRVARCHPFSHYSQSDPVPVS